MASVAAQELAQLRDIHLPDAIGWWPLAAGWFLVFSLLILCLTIALYYGWRWYKNSLPKRHALRLLNTYFTHYQTNQNSQLASARVSEILKRVALVYFPREKVASLNGDAWIQFLNETGQGIDFNRVRDALLKLPYSGVHAENKKYEKIDPLFQSAKRWINQRSKPCSN